MAECISEEVLTKRFPIRNTWLTQYQPQTHTMCVQKYLYRLPSDYQNPDETTVEFCGFPGGVPITETLERAIPVFKEAEIDIVEPERAHKGYGTPVSRMKPTNETSEFTRI